MTKPKEHPQRGGVPRNQRWRSKFLDALAATSNISAAAEAAGVPTATAYAAKKRDKAFHDRWLEALCEGYDHLEMTLLERMRHGTPASSDVKFDNAVALRLLGAHRDSALRQRAIRDNRNAAQVVGSINAKLEAMRQRAIAAGEDVWAEEGDDAEE